MALTERQTRLASAMLNDYACHLGNQCCNDWEYPADWAHQEKVDFCKGYHQWNGDPEEFNEELLRLSDFSVAAYLAHLLE